MIYELKAYVPHAGKEAAMRARFLDKTLPLFARHGITVSAVLEPQDKPRELWYVTRFDDEAARKSAWAAFMADPDWAAAKKASETDGPLMESQSTTVFNAVDGALLSGRL
jgi:hypothetical protein